MLRDSKRIGYAPSVLAYQPPPRSCSTLTISKLYGQFIRTTTRLVAADNRMDLRD